jgi:hypothetical protein
VNWLVSLSTSFAQPWQSQIPFAIDFLCAADIRPSKRGPPNEAAAMCERVLMLRYNIPDIRLLFENDPRFIAQF